LETNFLQLVRRFWWLLALGAIVAGLTARYIASQMTPTYEGVVSVLAGPINANYDTQRAAGNLARTYAGLATSGPVLERTIGAARVDVPITELRENVSATSNDVTRIVTVRVRDSDPERAAAIANALARQLIRLGATRGDDEGITALMDLPQIAELPEESREEIRATAARIFGESSAGRLRVVDPAVRPEEPIAPRVSLITLMGVFGGLLAAGLVIVVRDSMARGYESEDEIPAFDGPGSLGTVPAGRFKLVDPAESTRLVRDYRMLGAKINFSANGKPIRSILVTGADDGVGSGAVAANIAAAQADGSIRVTLLDANSSKGEITKLLNLQGQPGYADLLVDADGSKDDDGGPSKGSEPLDTYRVAQTDALAVIPSGVNTMSTLLDVGTARHLVERLQKDSDLVVINAPAADRESSTLVWARVADATVVVVRRRKTPRERIQRVLNSLSVADANVIGIVFKR